MMMPLGDGYSTCREHGGRFAGHLAALDHLEHEHADLVDQIRRVRVIPLAEGQDPAQAIAHEQPNRAARRRAMRERCEP